MVWMCRLFGHRWRDRLTGHKLHFFVPSAEGGPQTPDLVCIRCGKLWEPS